VVPKKLGARIKKSRTYQRTQPQETCVKLETNPNLLLSSSDWFGWCEIIPTCSTMVAMTMMCCDVLRLRSAGDARTHRRTCKVSVQTPKPQTDARTHEEAQLAARCLDVLRFLPLLMR
jgi:hypothetical protein